MTKPVNTPAQETAKYLGLPQDAQYRFEFNKEIKQFELVGEVLSGKEAFPCGAEIRLPLSVYHGNFKVPTVFKHKLCNPTTGQCDEVVCKDKEPIPAIDSKKWNAALFALQAAGYKVLGTAVNPADKMIKKGFEEFKKNLKEADDKTLTVGDHVKFYKGGEGGIDGEGRIIGVRKMDYSDGIEYTIQIDSNDNGVYDTEDETTVKIWVKVSEDGSQEIGYQDSYMKAEGTYTHLHFFREAWKETPS
jgi:hypothetical protein